MNRICIEKNEVDVEANGQDTVLSRSPTSDIAFVVTESGTFRRFVGRNDERSDPFPEVRSGLFICSMLC